MATKTKLKAEKPVSVYLPETFTYLDFSSGHIAVNERNNVILCHS